MEQISLFELETLPEEMQEGKIVKRLQVPDPEYARVLNPCPKCGHTPDLTKDIDTHGMREKLGDRLKEPTGKPIFEVYHPCRIGQEGNAFCSPAFWTAAEAIEDWNETTKKYVKE